MITSINAFLRFIVSVDKKIFCEITPIRVILVLPQNLSVVEIC